MLTIISGTNRANSLSNILVHHIDQWSKGIISEPIKKLLLSEIEFTLHSHQYAAEHQSPIIRKIEEEIILPSSKFIFVVPEYNGSYPGILKLFLDAISVRGFREAFQGKNALIMGLSTGRAGNLRGIEQLDAILQFLGMHTYPKKLPLSQFHKLIDGDEIQDEQTIVDIKEVLNSFLEFGK